MMNSESLSFLGRNRIEIPNSEPVSNDRVPQVWIFRPGIAKTFSACPSPEGLDLHDSVFPSRVMAEARPPPMFGPFNQTALDRVAMHVTQLLDALVFVVHVKVVVAREPKRPFSALNRHRQLEGLNCRGKLGLFGFADLKVNVFWHDYITTDRKVVPPTHRFERTLKKAARRCRAKVRQSTEAAECNEVEGAAVLIAN
jgi:hypothetical protein